MSVFSNYYNYAFQWEVVIRQESLVTTSGVQHQYVSLNTASPFDLSMHAVLHVCINVHACMHVCTFIIVNIHTIICKLYMYHYVCSTDHCMYVWDNMIMQSLDHIVQ